MKENLKNLIYSALFLTLGFVLPMLTGQIPVVGQALLPMHIPVFLCGLICGARYGALLGFSLPLLRSLIFSVPVMYPTAIAVAFEMAAYGLLSGLLYSRSKRKSLFALYSVIVAAMIVGRIVRCIAQMALLGLFGNPFVWQTFFSGVIVSSVPGIILQLIIIPAVMVAARRTAPITSRKNRATARTP